MRYCLNVEARAVSVEAGAFYVEAGAKPPNKPLNVRPNLPFRLLLLDFLRPRAVDKKQPDRPGREGKGFEQGKGIKKMLLLLR
jgi:hypothetical protein